MMIVRFWLLATLLFSGWAQAMTLPVPYLESPFTKVAIRHGVAVTSSIIYANDYATRPAGQSWGVVNDPLSADYGWTVVTPIAGPYTGTCSAGTYSVTSGGAFASCGIYFSDTGTGTLATCRVALTATFDKTTIPSDANACPMKATNMAGLREASPDMALLKCGDQFWNPDLTTNPRTGNANTTTTYGVATSSGRAPVFGRNGLSNAQPMVIMSYGDCVNNPRPVVQTIYNCMSNQGSPVGSGNYIMWLGIDCGNTFKDPNSAYYPGIITAAAVTAGGGTSITLSSPLPAYMGAAGATGGWLVADLDNPNSPAFNTGKQITNIDATRTVLTVQALCASCNVAIGDRMQFTQASAGGIVNISNASYFLYVEDSRFRFSGIGLQGTVNPMQLVVRRNVIENSYLSLNRGQGGFTGDTFSAASTAIVEENVVDHNGWLQLDGDCTPGQVMPAKCGGVASITPNATVQGSPPDQAQAYYFHEGCCTVTLARNILTNNSGAGAQTRSGGTSYNNFIARNGTGWSGGGILSANYSSYNVITQMTAGYTGIIKTSGATVSSNVLNFTNVPYYQAPIGYRIFNASNPSSIPSGSTIASVTATTITVTTPGAVTFSVASGDTIYIANYAAIGAAIAGAATTASFTADISGTTMTVSAFAASTSNIRLGMTIGGSTTLAGTKVIAFGTGTGQTGTYTVDTSQTVASASLTATPVGLGQISDVQWNIVSDAIPANYGIGVIGGYGYGWTGSTLRKAGSVFANNYGMNLPLFIEDQTAILGIDATGCGGNTRINVNTAGNPATNGWQNGETAIIAGVLGMTGVNGTWPVTVPDTGHLCLVGSTPSGTYTAGSGTINGGIGWASNKYSNVTALATPTNSQAAAPGVLASFAPAGTPTPEACDTQFGGDGTLAHFINMAKANRRGSWNRTWTAANMNNCIRARTDAAIAQQLQ